MSYGVTSEGFITKPLEVIKSEIEDKQRTDIHPALNQTATSVLGQLNGIFSAKLRELWELAEAVYNASDPDAANGSSLDNIAALCPGILRNPATRSRVLATINVDTGTYPAGTLIANVQDDPDARFVNTVDVVATITPFITNIVFEAEETGPIEAPAGTLIEIAEPVTGWNSITNATDAEIGEDIESDAELRLRREAEIRRTGSTNVDAIRADVLEVDGVSFCKVYENVLDTVFAGMLPHSVYVLFWDGDPPAADDAEVAETIFLSKAAGIATNGSDAETVTDSQGVDHTIRFDRAEEKTVQIQLTALTTDPPSDWQDQIKDALLEYFASEQDIAVHVIYAKLFGVAVDFDWIDDLTLFEIRFTGDAWGTANLNVTLYQIATLTDSDITFV